MQKASMQHHSTLSKAWTSSADEADPVLCVASSPSRAWLAVATSQFISIHSCDTLGIPTRRLKPNSGSNLLVLDLDGKVTCKFGPFESAISGLEWGPLDHLYIDLATRLLTTSCDESQPLLELHAEPSTALLVSTKASFLALGVASSASGFQVHVWKLASKSDTESQCEEGSSTSSTIMKGVITLNDYESEVTCMAWDERERYIATSDGAEATIWDIAEAQEGHSVMSVVCCGHSPKSRIEHMAFQPDGSFLATVGSDGRVLLFDSSLFMGGAGGVISPAAAQQISSPGSAIVGLEWLSGGKILAATSDGVITALQLSASDTESERDQTPPPIGVPSSVSTPPPLPPTTPTQAALLHLEGTPQAAKKRPLPGPVLLDEDVEDTTGQGKAAGKAVLNGPKLEIKTDSEGTPVLEATEGLHGDERTKSCNLSPLTPKFTPNANRFPGTKDSKDTGSVTSDTGLALYDSLSSLSPQGSVEVESASSAPKPPAELTQLRTASSPVPTAQATAANRPPKLRVETFANQQSPKTSYNRTSENGGYAGPRRTYSQDSYPAYGRSQSWMEPAQRQGSGGLQHHDRSSSISKVPPRSGSQGDAPPRTSALSPGLLQHIQAVKDNPQPLQHSHRSDLAGWGPGPLSPMPASAPNHQVQYMMPFGQQMGGGQMAPVFVPAHGPPSYGYYPFMGPQPMIHTAPPPGGPSSPSQPGTPSGRVRGPAPPPVPPPQSPMRAGVPSDFGAPRPVPAGPMMFVPAGAQPPQGWAPVMVPPPGWMGMYGQPPFMHPAPQMAPPQMAPPQEMGEDTFDQMPPFATPFNDDSVGISANPQVRWAAGYRSAPANLSRDQLMRGGGYYSKQPSARVFNGVPRPNPPPNNTSPASHVGKGEGGGSNSVSDAGSTGDNCSASGDKAPPTPTRSSFSCASPSFANGFAKPIFSAGGLLMSDGLGGEAPHPVTTLYVGNLPSAVDEYTLMTSFQFFGQITNIQEEEGVRVVIFGMECHWHWDNFNGWHHFLGDGFNVIRDKNSAQSRGFAFVTFAHPQAATNAQSYMNGMTLYGAFGGRSIRVGPSNRASSLAEE
ncbi:hypothetical protein COCSUDRAFT_57128 [Coccomyxa subellipsoidea C-169]|uniref:RRM domain-containing protein n=1 Tax=Coccomyxa subellipsoidea (strain C-169) TaxID=574566 RepID=I0YS49_COCSC|nr:hypothetical protein COCSUDRAFT_57128 [Coccomyxa subellipsoidea C-169]EIE21218.1 hypothetical protein COCSUDRAFT_57128 [Coccomyxa subellipsoidea C-169]|eukprot:XP_005645762.1 hypothetical protein COCSUDRAFT_57128 [Coccomyxa subellipsoidea C-169]